MYCLLQFWEEHILTVLYQLDYNDKVKQSIHKPGQISSRLQLSDFETIRPSLTHWKYSCYSFLLQAESTQRPQRGRKNYVNENIPVTPPESNQWASGL
jgi:hypothetical protein